MRFYHSPSRFMILPAVAVLLMLVTPAAHGEIKIYDAEAFVQSEKRGVAANSLSDADFYALSLGVSWWYNWSPTPGSTPPAGVDMDFVPMVWSNSQWSLDRLSSYLAAGNTPRQILAINEPNLRSQSNMTPEQSAAFYQQVKSIADQYGIPVSGPQMAAGSAPADSITAIDPDTGQSVM